MDFSFSARTQLADALFQCDCLKTPASRAQVAGNLPAEIQRRLKPGGSNIQDIHELISACQQFPGGLDAMLEIVQVFEGASSFSWTHLDAVVRRIRGGSSSPASPAKGDVDYLYDVFLSHSSADKPAAIRLADRLEDEAGLRPFLDKRDLIPGEPWMEALETALAESATFAVLIGPGGLGPWQNEEMRAALVASVADRNRRVISVLLPGADQTIPTFLSRYTWVDFSAGVEDGEVFSRLVAGIKGQKPGR
jgi:TIR domain/Effector-associated domain 2